MLRSAAHSNHFKPKGNKMHTSYRFKCSVNGGRMYQHFRDEQRRDNAAALLRSCGVIVETYEKEIEDAPPADAPTDAAEGSGRQEE
jgi:hypothetical protein